MTVASISTIRCNFEIVGSLREGERLQTNGRAFSKLKAPDRFLKKYEHPFLKLLHKIVTLALKIIQAFERFILEEKSDFNLFRVEEMTQELSNVLEAELPMERGAILYAVLQELGHVQKSLDQSIASSLENYKFTLLNRSASLNPRRNLDDSLRADRVADLVTKISVEVLPKLGQVIDQLELQVYEDDKIRSSDFLDRLFEKDPLELDFVVSRKASISVLKDKFGGAAVERALNYYGLEHERTLTGEDLAALVTGLLANITEEDLRHFLPDMDSVAEEDIGRELIALRASMVCPALLFDKSKPYYRQLEHDQMLLQYVNEIDDWTAETEETKVKGLKRYSYAEFLSRHLAYALFNKKGTQFPDGLLIPIYDDENTLRVFSAYELVSVKGLHGCLFKPFKSMEGENKVHVVFRGTYCKYSILRDISPTERLHSRLFDGPGRNSFTKHQEYLYNKILEHASSTEEPVIEFCGHSLGASDAMRAMEYFMYRQAEGPEQLPIKKFVLHAFNTPGVEPDVNRRFMRSLRTLGVETDLRYFDVHHDIIQQLGSTRLGYFRRNETCPEHLKLSIFKFNRKIEERLAALARNFFKRFRFNLEKALEAHTFYCLRLHDTYSTDNLNSTFIQDILTNNPKDMGVNYGQELKKVSETISAEELSDSLLTASCLVGRKLKRTGQKISAVFKRIFPFIKREITTA